MVHSLSSEVEVECFGKCGRSCFWKQTHGEAANSLEILGLVPVPHLLTAQAPEVEESWSEGEALGHVVRFLLAEIGWWPSGPGQKSCGHRRRRRAHEHTRRRPSSWKDKNLHGSAATLGAGTVMRSSPHRHDIFLMFIGNYIMCMDDL